MTQEQDNIGAFAGWLLGRMQEQIPGIRAGEDAGAHAERLARYAAGYDLVAEYRRYCEDVNKGGAQ